MLHRSRWRTVGELMGMGDFWGTLHVEGEQVSGSPGDVVFTLDYDGDGIHTGDVVNFTVVEIRWDDESPDYSLEDNQDSDNFFLRQGDDALLDLYWDILPGTLEPEAVKINIYEENTGEGVTLDAADGVPQTAGLDNHVQWDARTGGQYRNTSYYRVELEVQIASVTFKTPVGDADTEYPGWQCPQRGLGIHDLVWKHRPAVYMGDLEDIAPNGSCYAFEEAISGSGLQDTPNYRLREGGSEAWETEPNYSEWGEFPPPSSNFTEESYQYPVLDASASHPPTSDHAIDMLGYGESGSDDGPIIQPGEVAALLGCRGIPHPAGTNNHVFVHWWMYETASCAPYGIPGWFVHDADWEMLQLCIELRDPESPNNKAWWVRPWAATASQHYYGQTLAWRRDKQGSGTGDPLTRENQRYVLHADGSVDRFNIYIAENSHATYFQSGDIDVDVDAQTGTQCQYKPVAGGYDGCQAPLVPADYALMSLLAKGGAGLYDWIGRWGTHHDVPGMIIRGPALREVNPDITIAEEPVLFHNRCREHVDESGNFDEDGEDDPETKLRQVP